MPQEPKEIKQKRLVAIFKDVKRLKSEETRFCFLLGAGASKSSGIPTGWELATRWYRDLKEILDEDELKDWQSNIEGFDEERIGEFYTYLYQKRYESSPQIGYEEFKNLMQDKEPGIGYVILSQILAHEKHNFVITTNFDYLVEDAVRMYTPTKPFSAGHETLAPFISSQTERPTIIKVHRDLFLNPLNDEKETTILKEEWKKALGPILRDFHLLVIGYGGNDGSLMDYLQEIKAEDRKAIYWCKRKKDKLSAKVVELLEEKDFVVTINDFDKLMYGLYHAHDYNIFKELSTPDEHQFVKDAKKRIRNLNDKRNEILEELKEEGLTKDTSRNIKSLFKGGASEYQYKATVEEDIDEKEKIHLEGIKKYPNDANLLNNYGNYLYDNKRYEEAIEKYKKAIKAQADYHWGFSNWGLALGELADTKSGEAAEKFYHEAIEKHQKAIKIKPDYHEAFNNWGAGLGELADTKSGEAAEKFYHEAIEKYEKAIKIKPDYHEAFNNWGTGLGKLAGTKSGAAAEKLYNEAFEKYQKAIEIKPDYNTTFNNWGYHLGKLAKTKSGKEADTLWKEALEKCQRAIDLGGRKYTIARVYALRPDKKNALLYLKQSLEGKEVTTDYVLKDEDWQAYLNDKDFKKIIHDYSEK